MTTFTVMRHRGGYERPSDDEMQKLFDLVLTHRPELREGASFAEFPRAMLAVAHLGRTNSVVTSQYFSHWIEVANTMLAGAGLAPVGGSSLLAAIIGHGDVAYRLSDRFAGQPLECGLTEYGGRRCGNAWRDVLSGRAMLLKPVPSERHAEPLRTLHSAPE